MCGRLLPLRGKALHPPARRCGPGAAVQPASALDEPPRGPSPQPALGSARRSSSLPSSKMAARAAQAALSSAATRHSSLSTRYALENTESTIVRALYFNSHSLAGLLNRRVGGRNGELNGDLLQRRGLSLLAYSTCCKLFGSTGNCFCGAVYHCHANATAEGSGEQQRGSDLRRQPLDPSERPPCISAEQWSRCIHLNAPQSPVKGTRAGNSGTRPATSCSERV